MALRGKPLTWDEANDMWHPHVPKVYVNGEWRRPPDDYTSVRRSPFEPYIGTGTIWQRSVASMPLTTNSSTMAAWMAANINYGGGFGNTAFNTSQNGTHPIQVYMVDSRIPGTDYAYMTCGGVANTDAYAGMILNGLIPWPRYVRAANLQPGQDSAVVIVDIGTGIIREYWLVTADTGYDNKFTANVGGFSIYERDLTNLVTVNYPTQLQYGSNAVVKMHNWMGWIDIASVRRGQINHAIAFTPSNMATPTSSGDAILPNGTHYTWTGPSWPAQGGDGDSVPSGDNIPIHGQWAKLPSGLDLTSTGPYTPFERLVIKAVQTYGMVATDTNNFVHAFNGEPGFYEAQFLGTDPWAPTGDLTLQYQALNAKEGRSTTIPFSLANFPWGSTQWAPRNWGKPL